MFPPKKPEKRQDIRQALQSIEKMTMKMLADNARLIKKATATGGEKQCRKMN